MMTPMPGSTSLRLIATRQQRNIVDRLWQLYHHDLSEFRGYMPDGEGLYEPGRLPTFFEDPDRCGYLIYSGQALAGFALRSEEHTSELQSRRDLVCRLLLEKKKKKQNDTADTVKKKNR